MPTYDQFIEPLLRYLATRPDGVPAKSARDVLADQLKLSAEDRVARLPSGQQPVFHNRVGWAHDRLKRAGFSTSARRGLWQITDAGRQFVTNHPKPLGDAELDRLAKPSDEMTARPRTSGDEAAAATQPASATKSPYERIDEALTELNDSVAAELLSLITQASPAFFEQLVLDLLHAMGYGTERTDLQRVGGSGDGGIDGIISLDRLGLEKIYVQAKRWQNNVGRPEVQSFFGALAGRRASKGVFITTSMFTKDAREYAESVSGQLVLVDGARLAALMIEHQVGVTHKPINIARIDGDYFDDE